MRRFRQAAGLCLAGLIYFTAAAALAQKKDEKDKDKDKAPMIPAINPAVAKLDVTIGGLEGPAFDVVAGGGGKELIVVACESGAILAYKKDELPNLAKGAKPEVWKAHQGPVVALAWNGGPLLASAGA